MLRRVVTSGGAPGKTASRAARSPRVIAAAYAAITGSEGGSGTVGRLGGGSGLGAGVGGSSEDAAGSGVEGLRPLERVLDPEPVLSPTMLAMLREAADEYLCPLG